MTEHVLPRRRAWSSSRPSSGHSGRTTSRAILAPLIIVGVLIALLIVIRLLLDPIATRETRKALNQMDGFAGDFDRVHVTIFGPGYDITRLKLVQAPHAKAPVDKKGEHLTAAEQERSRAARQKALGGEPMVYVERAHIGVNWRELLHLRLVASLRLEEPKITIESNVKEKTPEPAAKKAAPDLSEQLQKVTAAKVDRIEVLRGELLFRQVGQGDRPAELWVHRLEAVAQNLATRNELAKGRPTTLSAHGIVGRSGDLSMFVSADALASPLSFAGQVALKGFRATELYQFMEPTAHMQAKQGTSDVFAEFVAKNGIITGGVKPVIKNLEIRSTEDGAWNRFKAWMVDKSVEFASDRVPERNAIATTLPIKGKLTDPDLQLWPAVLGVIRNAFVQGLAAGFTNVPPPTAHEKEGVLTQVKNALKKDQGPPKAQPADRY